ncbi:MAG: 4-hydroxythreonine-4-phosphate dehydrogenase PdxA [Balneolia bacterium]|nr:4-hydroxythreonine-4-phosphate dehydrogenase PdxA [Balneolia bacterium]
MQKPFLVITPGDINGIGPEAVLKALQSIPRPAQPVLLLGTLSAWQFYGELIPNFSLTLKEVESTAEVTEDGIYVLNPVPETDIKPEPGKLTKEAGLVSMLSIAKAVDLCLSGEAVAMVTAPISKEAVNLAGYHIPGHTEYLAERDEAEDVAMMLVNKSLRVVPLTTHIPVSEVSKAITERSIITKARIIKNSLLYDFGIASPKIAILGLNPHAGDGGVIGREEIEVISPAIQSLKQEEINCDGPFPADGFFATGSWRNYDAILSMYHDQGLIPFKTLSFNQGVNFTAGLSFIRTSPDHGTAFSIAGKNAAEHGSTTEAITLALSLGSIKVQSA